MKQGLFITFEGIDGSGKSTQAKRLYDRLLHDKAPVELLRDPGGTEVSEKIREILLSTLHEVDNVAELLLYESARAQMVAEKIRPWLDEGKIVVLDRYYDSTTAYQGYGRGIALSIIHSANQIGSQGLDPDLTILVDIDWETARRRRAGTQDDRLEKEGRDFFERVRGGYMAILRDHPERVRRVDGSLAADALAASIWEVCAKHLPA